MSMDPSLAKLIEWLDEVVPACAPGKPDGFMFHIALANALHACFPNAVPVDLSSRASRPGDPVPVTPRAAAYRGVALQWGKQLYRMNTCSPWLHPTELAHLQSIHGEKLQRTLAIQDKTRAPMVIRHTCEPRRTTVERASAFEQELTARLRALVQAADLTQATPSSTANQSAPRL